MASLSEPEMRKVAMAGAIKATEMDIMDDLRRQQALIDDYLFFAVGVDGLIFDPEKALDMTIACKCTKVEKEDGDVETLCFKKGVVGMLAHDQVNELCPLPERTYPESTEGLSRHLEAFVHASEACKDMKMDTLEERLACMSAELKSRKQALGEVYPTK